MQHGQAMKTHQAALLLVCTTAHMRSQQPTKQQAVELAAAGMGSNQQTKRQASRKQLMLQLLVHMIAAHTCSQQPIEQQQLCLQLLACTTAARKRQAEPLLMHATAGVGQAAAAGVCCWALLAG
jgi:hypothetical protein